MTYFYVSIPFYFSNEFNVKVEAWCVQVSIAAEYDNTFEVEVEGAFAAEFIASVEAADNG